VITSQDADIDIEHGKINIHVSDNGTAIENAPVYLFTGSGSYLGKYLRTDPAGRVSFMLPEKPFKFRVDVNAKQYWSAEITPAPHGETTIEMPLEQIVSQLTNDPNPIRFDGTPPEPEKVMLASLGTITGLISQTVVAQIPAKKIYYYLNDHLGTPIKVIDENKTVVWAADYKPFGEVDILVDAFENNFRFPGQYYDQESDLHYNYHRYYNPQVGRYLRADPIGIQDGSPNLYLYSYNNSLRYYDHKGLSVLAMCTYSSAGDIIGGGLLECELTQFKCINGIREKAKYLSIVGGLTAGAPAGRTSFSMTFKKVDDVRDLRGKSEVAAASSAIGGGVSWGKICLGNDCAQGWTVQKGLDLSADLFVGYGWVFGIRQEECCDE